MKRIPADLIVNAYKAVEFSPTWRSYCLTGSYGQITCGCPLTALAISLGMREESEEEPQELICQIKEGKVRDWLVEKHGYEEGYLEGFIAGVDDRRKIKEPKHQHEVQHNIGHDDGRAAWMAVCDELEVIW